MIVTKAYLDGVHDLLRKSEDDEIIDCFCASQEKYSLFLAVNITPEEREALRSCIDGHNHKAHIVREFLSKIGECL